MVDSANSDRGRAEWLVSSLAHELRQPLSVLRTAVEVARAGLDVRAATDLVAVMERQIDRMNRVIEDLLEASRWAHGKVLLRKRRVDARTTLRDAARDAMGAIAGRGHELLITTAPGPLWVDADPGRLQQAIANLLDNAMKFTDPPGRISLVAEQRDATVRLSVIDTGCGIAQADLPHVFDRFTQVRPLEGAGLGIGLSVVRDIVAMHDGVIEPRSDGMGRGSEFTITLPLAAPPAGPARPAYVKEQTI